MCKAHRLVHHSTLGLRVIKKKKTPLKPPFRTTKERQLVNGRGNYLVGPYGIGVPRS